MSYNNKDLADLHPKKNKGKSKKTKDVNNLFLEEVRSFYKKNSNNHNNTNDYMQLEEENEISCEKKYILGIVCKNTSNDNNSNYQELVCPLCNKTMQRRL